MMLSSVLGCAFFLTGRYLWEVAERETVRFIPVCRAIQHVPLSGLSMFWRPFRGLSHSVVSFARDFFYVVLQK